MEFAFAYLLMNLFLRSVFALMTSLWRCLVTRPGCSCSLSAQMGIVQILRCFECIVQQNGREYVFNKISIMINVCCLSFLSRVSTLMRDIDIANLSVCPSVRNVPVSDEDGLTYRHSFFHHTVAQSFCFISIKHIHEIPTGSPRRVAKYRWGIKISRFSTNKSLYLVIDTR